MTSRIISTRVNGGTIHDSIKMYNDAEMPKSKVLVSWGIAVEMVYLRRVQAVITCRAGHSFVRCSALNLRRMVCWQWGHV